MEVIAFLILPVCLWALIILSRHSLTHLPTKDISTGCALFSRSFDVSYQYSVHHEEKVMPIAYTLTVYTDLDRTIRLLRAIHRPQNVYCVHVDKKTELNYALWLRNVTSCIGDNIFIVPDANRLDVRWGTATNLLPDLICAGLLLKKSRSWKYLINLTGQEFPLKTNWEIATALLALNGTNLVGSIYKTRNLWRLPPANFTTFNVTYYKSEIHVALRREFVEFMLRDKRARELLRALMMYERYIRGGIHMDETFYATLDRNPKLFPIPGASLETYESDVSTYIREKTWCGTGMHCGSKTFKRCVCMYGLLDLPFLMNSSNFFANKFDISVQPEAYKLLESWISSKMLHEKIHNTLHPSFNVSVYAKSRTAWNHL